MPAAIMLVEGCPYYSKLEEVKARVSRVIQFLAFNFEGYPFAGGFWVLNPVA